MKKYRNTDKDDKEGSVQKAIDKASERLKSDKVRVRILRARDSLYVQFTAPLMPGDTQKGARPNKQYKKSLALKATVDGVKRAYTKALELGYKLEHNQFKWEDYPDWLKEANLTTESEFPKKIKELLEIYEKEYFLRRKRNRQSEGTFRLRKQVLENKLNLEEPLTKKNIDEAIAKTGAGTAIRVILVSGLSNFCNHVNFKYDFKGLNQGYTPKSRELPSDEQIIESWSKIQVELVRNGAGKGYGWAFGMLATYGLRPSELLAIDYKKSLKPPFYEVYLDPSLTDGLKTDGRIVFPLPLHWVHEFDLLNVKNEPFIYVAFDRLRNKLSERFLERHLGFVPYDLRHRYAIRGHELELPIGQMAKWMGHSVQMHTDTYQKWMPDSSHRRVYEQVLERAKKSQEVTEEMPKPDDLVRENAELQEQVRWLTAQVAELKN
jgi:integrase